MGRSIVVDTRRLSLKKKQAIISLLSHLKEGKITLYGTVESDNGVIAKSKKVQRLGIPYHEIVVIKDVSLDFEALLEKRIAQDKPDVFITFDAFSAQYLNDKIPLVIIPGLING